MVSCFRSPKTTLSLSKELSFQNKKYRYYKSKKYPIRSTHIIKSFVYQFMLLFYTPPLNQLLQSFHSQKLQGNLQG